MTHIIHLSSPYLPSLSLSLSITFTLLDHLPPPPSTQHVLQSTPLHKARRQIHPTTPYPNPAFPAPSTCADVRLGTTGRTTSPEPHHERTRRTRLYHPPTRGIPLFLRMDFRRYGTVPTLDEGFPVPDRGIATQVAVPPSDGTGARVRGGADGTDDASTRETGR